EVVRGGGDIYEVALLVVGPPRTRRAQNGQTAVRARRRLLSRPGRSLCRGREISGAAGGFGSTACGSAGLTLLAGALAALPFPQVNECPAALTICFCTFVYAAVYAGAFSKAEKCKKTLRSAVLFFGCPRYPRKRPYAAQLAMSAMGQKRTSELTWCGVAPFSSNASSCRSGASRL